MFKPYIPEGHSFRRCWLKRSMVCPVLEKTGTPYLREMWILTCREENSRIGFTFDREDGPLVKCICGYCGLHYLPDNKSKPLLLRLRIKKKETKWLRLLVSFFFIFHSLFFILHFHLPSAIRIIVSSTLCTNSVKCASRLVLWSLLNGRSISICSMINDGGDFIM